MSVICEPTPPQQVLRMCPPWGEKERTCLDSTPRSRERRDKEGGSVIVSVDSVEEKEAKSKKDDGLQENSHQGMPF